MTAAQRELERALRALDAFDRTDKGSRWITEPDVGHALVARVRELDAIVEQEEGSHAVQRGD